MPISLVVEGLSAKRGEDLIFHDYFVHSQCRTSPCCDGAERRPAKSTLLRVLAGLLAAESRHGATGRSARRKSASPRELCHYLGHRNAMKRELTVEENLSFWKSFMGDSAGGSGLA